MSAPSEAVLAAPGATPRNAPTFGAATTGKVGMWVFLVTDAMTFAGLLLAYAILLLIWILVPSAIGLMAQIGGGRGEPWAALAYMSVTLPIFQVASLNCRPP